MKPRFDLYADPSDVVIDGNVCEVRVRDDDGRNIQRAASVVHARSPRWPGPLCRHQCGVASEALAIGVHSIQFLLVDEGETDMSKVTCNQCRYRLGLAGTKRKMPMQHTVRSTRRPR